MTNDLIYIRIYIAVQISNIFFLPLKHMPRFIPALKPRKYNIEHALGGKQ